MPVQKFRTHDEARQALWRTPDDPRLIPAIVGLFDLSRRFARVRPPAGLRKFRSLEDAQRERDGWSVDLLSRPADDPNGK
jgi:hypothetical protein